MAENPSSQTPNPSGNDKSADKKKRQPAKKLKPRHFSNGKETPLWVRLIDGGGVIVALVILAEMSSCHAAFPLWCYFFALLICFAGVCHLAYQLVKKYKLSPKIFVFLWIVLAGTAAGFAYKNSRQLLEIPTISPSVVELSDGQWLKSTPVTIANPNPFPLYSIEVSVEVESNIPVESIIDLSDLSRSPKNGFAPMGTFGHETISNKNFMDFTLDEIAANSSRTVHLHGTVVTKSFANLSLAHFETNGAIEFLPGDHVDDASWPKPYPHFAFSFFKTDMPDFAVLLTNKTLEFNKANELTTLLRIPIKPNQTNVVLKFAVSNEGPVTAEALEVMVSFPQGLPCVLESGWTPFKKGDSFVSVLPSGLRQTNTTQTWGINPSSLLPGDSVELPGIMLTEIPIWTSNKLYFPVPFSVMARAKDAPTAEVVVEAVFVHPPTPK